MRNVCDFGVTRGRCHCETGKWENEITGHLDSSTKTKNLQNLEIYSQLWDSGYLAESLGSTNRVRGYKVQDGANEKIDKVDGRLTSEVKPFKNPVVYDLLR